MLIAVKYLGRVFLKRRSAGT